MKNILMNTLLIFTLLSLIFVFNYIDNKKETIVKQVEYTENNFVAEEKEIVYDGLTFDELVEVLDTSLKDDLAGTGYLYAKYALQYGVDPYLAVGISLHETGCNDKCSDKVVSCNNVGGQRFKPTCYDGGTYGRYDTLEAGIEGFIRNIYNNYVRYGMLTSYEMEDKYVGTGSKSWAPKVEGYIAKSKEAALRIKESA